MASPLSMFGRARKERSREDEARERFEAAILPHLPAAYDLARWLARDDAQAEDVVQTACLRALQGFTGFQGVNARAWLLTIVRNTFYSWLKKNRPEEAATPFDEELHAVERTATDPEIELLRSADRQALRQGFLALPLPFREVMVLRELEGLSYKEISAIAGIPIGTVMSRLARARAKLQEFLLAQGGTR